MRCHLSCSATGWRTWAAEVVAKEIAVLHADSKENFKDMLSVWPNLVCAGLSAQALILQLN